MVRAVSPGKFVQPGATIEDMYRPEFRGNTDAGKIEIQVPGAAPAKASAPAALDDKTAPATPVADATAKPTGWSSRMVTTLKVTPDGRIVGVTD